jgi:NAD(P)-dependent dehydrogenase (short-subunit alcohol dehydrogenase family)
LSGQRKAVAMGAPDGKVAIVTGATSGLGEATALEMAREGACVVVAGRREVRGRAVAQAITDNGGQAMSSSATRR